MLAKDTPTVRLESSRLSVIIHLTITRRPYILFCTLFVQKYKSREVTSPCPPTDLRPMPTIIISVLCASNANVVCRSPIRRRARIRRSLRQDLLDRHRGCHSPSGRRCDGVRLSAEDPLLREVGRNWHNGNSATEYS